MASNFLPEKLASTALCFITCKNIEVLQQHDLSSHEVDVAFCNSNGYLIEVLNSRVVNSCELLMNNASKLLIYYKYNENGFQVYYLIGNNQGLLVIVKKQNNMLMVVKRFSHIKYFGISDYECRGFPQVKIQDMNSDAFIITSFNDLDDFQITPENVMCNYVRECKLEEEEAFISSKSMDFSLGILNEMPIDTVEENAINDFLIKKLNGLEKFADELRYENYNLKRILEDHCGGSHEKYNVYVNDPPNMHIRVVNVWQRIHQQNWIIGFEMLSDITRNPNDVRIAIWSRSSASHRYKIFTACSEEERMKKARENRSKKHEIDDHLKCSSKFIAVVAVRLPIHQHRKKDPLTVFFMYNNVQFHAEDVLLESELFKLEKYQLFQQKNEPTLSEDVMSCIVLNREVSFVVTIAHNLGTTLQGVLMKNLGFIQCELTEGTFLVKFNGHLIGTVISLERVSSTRLAWKMKVCIREIFDLTILIGLLYNELPMPLRIRLDGSDENSDCTELPDSSSDEEDG